MNCRKYLLFIVEISALAYRLVPLCIEEHNKNFVAICCLIVFDIALTWLAVLLSHVIGKHRAEWYKMHWNVSLWILVWFIEQGVYIYKLIPMLEAEHLPIGGKLLSTVLLCLYAILCSHIDEKMNTFVEG